jgi:hypothetical protein
VSFAVDLNCQPTCEASEIQDQIAKRMLPAELVPAGSLAEFTPEQHFR